MGWKDMKHDKLVTKAVGYMKKEFARNELSLQEVADCVGFSQDYFNRLFVAQTGFTVMSYVTYLRLKEAKLLLRNSDKSILDIALEVGYESHEAFARVFKKHFGKTPSEFRKEMHGKAICYGELVDESVVHRFCYQNPKFVVEETDVCIEYLLSKSAKQWGHFCAMIQGMGMQPVTERGKEKQEYLFVGDNLRGDWYLEAVTDTLEQLSKWLEELPKLVAFYSDKPPEIVERFFKEKYGDAYEITAIPQSIYSGPEWKDSLPDGILVRELCYEDKDSILVWAKGKTDGYIKHLLSKRDYEDDVVLEYGVFRNNHMIGAVGCGIDRVCGLEYNDSCNIKLTKGIETDELYRGIFAFIVNDVMRKGLIPFDDLQHGVYAKSHGNFTAEEMGFEVVNWRYEIKSH